MTGGDAHDTTEPGGPPPADDTFAAGQDAPVPAGFGQAGGLVPGVLPGSDDRSTIEAEAPAFEPEGGTGADVHGPPGPAGGPAPDTPAEQSGDAVTASSAGPTERRDRPGVDLEVGVPGEGADVPPTVSAVADAAGGTHDHGLSDTSTAPPAAAHADEPPTEGGTDGSDDNAARYPPAPPVPATIWLPTPAPDAAGDNGTVEHDRASSSGDEGGGAGAPDPGPSPVEASPASAEGTGADEGAGGGERGADLGSAALFELNLGKLAERARASALRQAVPAAPRPLDPGSEPDPSPVTARDLQDPFPPPAPGPEPAPAPAPPPLPLPVTAPSAAEDEPGQPVAPEPAPPVWGDATQAFDLSLDEEDEETDSTEADPAAGRPQGKLYAPVQAAWPAGSTPPRYPRGQLREPIGIVRRIRAMLGIVVVTVLLGVAAGTAVGAFIFFLAFAVRNAITAQ